MEGVSPLEPCGASPAARGVAVAPDAPRGRPRSSLRCCCGLGSAVRLCSCRQELLSPPQALDAPVDVADRKRKFGGIRTSPRCHLCAVPGDTPYAQLLPDLPTWTKTRGSRKASTVPGRSRTRCCWTRRGVAQLQSGAPHLVAASAIGSRVIALGADGWMPLRWPDATVPTDSGTTDSGTTDSGTTDSGTTDSGTTDSGTTDSGTTDSGTTDSGTTDDELAEPASDYVVQAGDYLGRIAAHCYGDGSRWREIWEANRDRVMGDGLTFSNPHLIHAGWTLHIPDSRRMDITFARVARG